MFSATQNVSQSSIDGASKIVEAFFHKVNIDPNTQKLKMDKGMGWTINRGSAIIYIILDHIQGVDTVRIASPIIYLPQDNLLPLYRRILELNFQTLSCAFAINKDMVAVVAERPINGMDLSEFEGLVVQVGHVADTFDNKLADEFGARLYSQK